MKLCVFDIDGTIVPDKEEMHAPVAEAIREFLSRGNAIALASGRPFPGIEKFFHYFSDSEQIYALASNGAAIYDRHGNTLRVDGMPKSVLREFVDRFKKTPEIDCYAYAGPDAICCTRLTPNIEWEYRYNKIHYHIPYDPALSNIKGDEILKVMIVAQPDVSKDIRFSEEDRARFSIVRSTPEYIELMAPGVDKATAVAHLAEGLGIVAEDVYCFGDAGNDIGMLEAFHGVAMGNATEEAKAAAEYLTKPCQEDGVAHALREILHLI